MESMSTVHYDRVILAYSLGIQLEELPLLALMAGNGSVPYEKIRDYDFTTDHKLLTVLIHHFISLGTFRDLYFQLVLRNLSRIRFEFGSVDIAAKEMVLNRATMKVVCTPSSSTKMLKESTSTKMKVYIRVRPFNNREDKAGCRDVIRVVDDSLLIFDPREDDQPFFFHGVKQSMRDITKKQNKEMQFVFDRVFGAQSTNEDLFSRSICGIFASLLDGYNCSVFVYGATGAGKTFTMLGNEEMPGVIFLTMRSLFEKIDQIQDKHFDIGISYLEVYNENVHDLLNPSSGPLHLREDPANGVIVAGLKLVQIEDAEHLFELLRQGNANRTQHPTDANAESSRSHAVFQVFIKIQSDDGGRVQLVKLSMIDLAGSERGAATNCRGARFKEGANINKSLLALGNCINNLADGVRHIPYRDSKLTRLLKDSLGGNCQTVMIACIGPTSLSYEDTYNTLKYAARARTIKTKMMKTILGAGQNMQQFRIVMQEKNELEKRVEEVTREIRELRRAAKLPSQGSLDTWIGELISLYRTKKNIHQQILKLESKEKITRWRIKYKQNNAKRVQTIDDSDNRDVNPLEAQINRMAGQISGVHAKIDELWGRKIEVDQKLSDFHERACAENITEPLAIEVLRQESDMSQMEFGEQFEHYIKLMKLLYKTTINQEDLFSKVVELYEQQHNLLRGFNKITTGMTSDRKDLVNLLKVKNNITCEISPTFEAKEQSDDFQRYAFLSLNLLLTDQKPCPLIVQDLEEFSPVPVVSPAPVVSPMASPDNAIANTTFTLPENKPQVAVVSKQKSIVTAKPKKIMSIKENRLPRNGLNCPALPVVQLNKSKSILTTPKMKPIKRLLTPTNR